MDIRKRDSPAMASMLNYDGAVIKGTQREYSSKPLKRSIVKRILVFNGRYWHILSPTNLPVQIS